jgi:hypothetical protein
MRPLGTEVPAFLLASQNPILAGCRAFQQNCITQQFHMSVANRTRLIHQMAQIHHALSVTNCLEPVGPWRDIEFLEGQCGRGRESFFLGAARPRNFAEARKCFQTLTTAEDVPSYCFWSDMATVHLLNILNRPEDQINQFRALRKLLLDNWKWHSVEIGVDYKKRYRDEDFDLLQGFEALNFGEQSSCDDPKPRRRGIKKLRELQLEEKQLGIGDQDTPAPATLLYELLLALEDEQNLSLFSFASMTKRCEKLCEEISDFMEETLSENLKTHYDLCEPYSHVPKVSERGAWATPPTCRPQTL